MQQKQQDGFDVAISRCCQAFDAFQQLAARTDEALYRALGEIYTLLVRVRTDAALRDEFDRLLQQPTSGRPINEALLLVKYAFFPDTLTPGPGHKSAITKASRYAKLIKNIGPSNSARAVQWGPIPHYVRPEAIGDTGDSAETLRRRHLHHEVSARRDPLPNRPGGVGKRGNRINHHNRRHRHPNTLPGRAIF